MKIVFVKSPVGAGFAYHKGEELNCSTAFGKEMINLGYAEEISSDSGNIQLPLDLPGLEAFIEAGFKTMDDVKAITDFDEIKGIGKATAEKIVEYLTK